MLVSVQQVLLLSTKFHPQADSIQPALADIIDELDSVEKETLIGLTNFAQEGTCASMIGFSFDKTTKGWQGKKWTNTPRARRLGQKALSPATAPKRSVAPLSAS